MSFTSTIKNEISKIDVVNTERQLSYQLFFAILLVLMKIKSKQLRKMQQLVESLFIKDIYGINCKITTRKGYTFKSYLYILEINNKANEILNDLSILDGNKYLSVPKAYVLDDDELVRSYLRGLFMACGS